MKKIIGCFLFSFLFHTAFGQIKEIDSLNRLLALAKEDTAKVQVLVALSFYDQSFENGLRLAQQGLELAKKINYKKGEAQSLHQIANQFSFVNNFPLALHYLIESLKIKEQLNDQEGYSRSLSAIGSVYKSQGNYKTALSYYFKAYEIQKPLKNNYWMAYAAAGIGETYEGMNQLDSALQYFLTSYTYFNSAQDKYQMVKALNGLGSVHSKMGNLELALSYYRLGMINGVAYSDSAGLPNNYLGIAKVFQKMGQTDSSIAYAKKVLNSTPNLRGPVVIEAGKILFKLYQNRDDKEAAKYLSIAMDAKDSSFNAEKSLQIQNLFYNEQERQQEIAAAELKVKEERNHNLQYAAIAVALITFIILFLVLSRSIIVKQKFIEFFAILGLLAVFEFINLFIHPYLANITNNSPVLMLIILIAIGALLIPLHHKLEKWITKIMIEKNKKIRLEAARKTIATLEPASAKASADKPTSVKTSVGKGEQTN